MSHSNKLGCMPSAAGAPKGLAGKTPGMLRRWRFRGTHFPEGILLRTPWSSCPAQCRLCRLRRTLLAGWDLLAHRGLPPKALKTARLLEETCPPRDR